MAAVPGAADATVCHSNIARRLDRLWRRLSHDCLTKRKSPAGERAYSHARWLRPPGL